MSSVLFIGVVFSFLLLLINIAGRRWESEGRFAGLDDNASQGNSNGEE